MDRSSAEQQETAKRGQRVRIASVDSDITVLTNPSECSISVISETSSENDNSKTMAAAVATDSFDPVTPALVHSVAVSDPANNKDEITPLGSPLSNSVCSSMVSSVYQNSVIAADDIATETDTLVNKSSGDDLTVYQVNSSGQINSSIYDSVNKSGDEVDQSNPVSSKDCVDSCNENSDLFKRNSEEMEWENYPGVDNSNVLLSRDRSAAILEQPFTDIDHRLKLHLMMTLFEDTEDFECIFKVKSKSLFDF